MCDKLAGGTKYTHYGLRAKFVAMILYTRKIADVVNARSAIFALLLYNNTPALVTDRP